MKQGELRMRWFLNHDSHEGRRPSKRESKDTELDAKLCDKRSMVDLRDFKGNVVGEKVLTRSRNQRMRTNLVEHDKSLFCI
jgi:hypothetical protein